MLTLEQHQVTACPFGGGGVVVVVVGGGGKAGGSSLITSGTERPEITDAGRT